MLASLKLDVIEAESGENIKEFRKEDFELLVSDVILPGELKGPNIARQLRNDKPRLAVLYMSGFQQGILTEDDLALVNVDFIQKPFSRNDFAIKIEALLETINTA